MSSYKKITRHPNTGIYEEAFYIDDYFGPHIYGVRFDSDNKVYPTDLVEERQIDHFWAEDVLAAFRYVGGFGANDKTVLLFLNQIEKEYKARWQRDPFGGEGAYLPCEHFVQNGECINCRIVIEEDDGEPCNV